MIVTFAGMSEALASGTRIPTPVVVPTFWCTTCQMSLRSQDERVAHLKLFPVHSVKPLERLICPSCGNVMPLENGRFPDHWVGGERSMKKCSGSRMAA